MANGFMADIGALGASSITPKKSTSREGNTEMKMEDFLTLMVVQLQNQTIDDTADTGEMLNQLVQMQMVTALSNMTDASIMSYASSLVGKEVTVGYVDDENNLHEEVLKVIGTGVYDGQQVIFCEDGKMYALSQIMAVGRLPDPEEPEEPGEPDKDEEQEKLEKEANARIDKLVSNIKNGNITGDTSEKTNVSGIGAVNGTNTDNKAENSTETEAGSGTVDPLEGGLLDGLLKDPDEGKTVETYTGEQGIPTDET